MRQAGAGNQADAYLTELQVRKRVFLRHCLHKNAIILPRQARDKQRKG
jgi:hypothetical protein